jgi:hypothetical protein
MPKKFVSFEPTIVSKIPQIVHSNHNSSHQNSNKESSENHTKNNKQIALVGSNNQAIPIMQIMIIGFQILHH